MNIAARPLTDEELDELDELLYRVGGSRSMNVEELDGFQCALIAGPELPSIQEYLPKILGGEAEEVVVPTGKTVNRLLSLLMQNWNSIVAELQGKGFHVPLVLCDEKGIARGNDWASGFLGGTEMRKEAWRELFQDENKFAPMIPIIALAYEDHPDKRVRPYKKPISKKLRRELIAGAAAAVKVLYDRRLQSRREGGRAATQTKPRFQRTATVGRNDACYCGSGKKYKKCCGAIRVN